jgi:2-polyprenyl-6-hydroxyphenyl methylase/3-demethylubiquinone-9 3-methyltransferase
MTLKSAYSPSKPFEFGENWRRFLSVLDESRLSEAESSLKRMLGVESLKGKSFLDAGSGSGLFSLAARRLGARVHSFDYDPESVACARELKNRFFPSDQEWQIEQGSVVDGAYMSALGKFDIVYSWGVLHHTGAMWLGLELLIGRVAQPGQLFIAIYNDQGLKSHVWWVVKYIYCRLPYPLNRIYGYVFGLLAYGINFLKCAIQLRPLEGIKPLLNYKKKRGMSFFHDLIDWIGGFPYEFSRFDILESYLDKRGFELVNCRVASSLGCHEIVAKL